MCSQNSSGRGPADNSQDDPEFLVAVAAAGRKRVALADHRRSLLAHVTGGHGDREASFGWIGAKTIRGSNTPGVRGRLH